MKSNFFLTVLLLLVLILSQKNIKQSSLATFGKKKLKKTPKNGHKMTKFQGYLEYQGKLLGEKLC